MTMPEGPEFDMAAQAYPPYTQPAVSVRATWAATDGSRPEEVIVEWREVPPAREIIALTLAVLRGAGATADLAASGVEREAASLFPSSDCGATGEGHDGDAAFGAGAHWCVMPKGHEPVELSGRAHRCACGGLFAAHGEVLDVPGRSSRNERPGRGR